MTVSTATAAAPAQDLQVGPRLAAVAQQLLVVAIDRLAAVAADKAEDLAGQLEDVVANGGVGLGAAFGAGQAYMTGRNPVWGAIKGGFGALSTGAKVGVIALLVLLGLLSPVALLLVLVGLLVAAIVKASKSS